MRKKQEASKQCTLCKVQQYAALLLFLLLFVLLTVSQMQSFINYPQQFGLLATPNNRSVENASTATATSTSATTTAHSSKKPLPRYDDPFQRVFPAGHSFNLMVYSAWFDPRLPNLVRILGINQNALSLPAASDLMCVFHRQNSSAEPLLFNQQLVPLWVLKSVKDVRRLDDYHKNSVDLFCETVQAINAANWSVSVVLNNKSPSSVQCCDYSNSLLVHRIEIRPGES